VLRSAAVKVARILEVFAWTAGVALLVTYGSAQWWIAQASDAGITAFREAQTAHQSAAASIVSPPGRPDTSLWSEKRIEEYEAALVSSELPEAVLRIPTLALEVPVYGGTSELNLNRGAGRVEGTPPAGTAGNSGIAAHRDGYFRKLKDIKLGDEVLVDTVEGSVTFRVVSTTIVMPSEVSVLAPTSHPTITLVTCYPFYFVGSAPQRFIVRAETSGEAALPTATALR